MKNLFAKCLAALLVAVLLLSPVALMEETPAEPVEAENVTNEAEDAATEAETVTTEAETVTNEAEDAATEDAHEEEATEEIIFEDVDEAIEEEDLAELDVEEEYCAEAEFVSSDAMDALYGAEPTPDVDGNGNIKLNATNFPNADFRNYIVNIFDNAPKDGVLSDSELRAITEITIPESVTDATGVKHLKYLQKFDCSYGHLAALDVSGCTALKYLYCDNNQLTTLNVTGCAALKELVCYYNQLTTLDVTGCTALESLSCGYNQLTALNVTGCTALKHLHCYNNQLTTLDVTDCTALKHLYCEDNQLTALDVTGFTALRCLGCANNQLTTLDVTGFTALESLSCADNQLTTLDVTGCTALEELRCYNNQLTTLDISNCTALRILWCYDNKLTTLDIRNCTAFAEHVTSANYTLSERNSVIYEYEGDIYVYLECDRDVTIISINSESNTSPGSTISNPGADSGAVTTAPQEPITIASVPAKVKAKATKNKVTVSWKKLKKTKKNKAMFAQIKAIQVQCATDPGFTQDVMIKSVGKKKAKAVFKLRKKTTYYFRTRYIDATGGASKWGVVKRVKTK